MAAVVLGHLIRKGLGLFFLVVALRKLADFGEFERLVGDFGIVHDGLVGATAVLLIVLEGISGLLLITGKRLGLALAAGLLVLFLCVLAYGIRLGLDVECGCLGIGPRGSAGSSLSTALVRDLLLLALVALAWERGRRQRRNEVREPMDPGPPGGGESRP